GAAHTDGTTLAAAAAIGAEARRLGRVRIRLQGDLDIVSEGPMMGRAIDDGSDRLRLHQRRRAAAEKDAADAAARRLLRPMVDLGDERAAPARVVDVLAHM